MFFFFTHSVLNPTYTRYWGNKETIPVFKNILPNRESISYSDTRIATHAGFSGNTGKAH